MMYYIMGPMTYSIIGCMHMIMMKVTCTCRYLYLTPHEHYMILPALGISAASLLLYICIANALGWLHTGQRLNIGTIWKKLSKLVFTLTSSFSYPGADQV